MTILVTLPSSDTIECHDHETIDDLKKEIEKLIGTTCGYQQLFTIESDRPLEDRNEIVDNSYYLIIKSYYRGVCGGWAGWAITHPVLGSYLVTPFPVFYYN